MVESYSEDEGESTSPRLSIGDTGYDSVTSSTTAPAGEIRSLIERKEELEKRQRKQDRHRQRVQVSYICARRNSLACNALLYILFNEYQCDGLAAASGARVKLTYILHTRVTVSDAIIY